MIHHKRARLNSQRLDFVRSLYKRQFIGSLVFVLSAMTNRSWDRFSHLLKDRNLTFSRKTGKMILPLKAPRFKIKKGANTPSGLRRRGAIRSRARPGGSGENAVPSVSLGKRLGEENTSGRLAVLPSLVRPKLTRDSTIPKHFPVGWKEGSDKHFPLDIPPRKDYSLVLNLTLDYIRVRNRKVSLSTGEDISSYLERGKPLCNRVKPICTWKRYGGKGSCPFSSFHECGDVGGELLTYSSPKCTCCRVHLGDYDVTCAACSCCTCVLSRTRNAPRSVFSSLF